MHIYLRFPKLRVFNFHVFILMPEAMKICFANWKANNHHMQWCLHLGDIFREECIHSLGKNLSFSGIWMSIKSKRFFPSMDGSSLRHKDSVGKSTKKHYSYWRWQPSAFRLNLFPAEKENSTSRLSRKGWHIIAQRT